MNIEIENIGLFKKASAEISGLCVIAGVNDTGKSTLGKIVYSVVQGIKRHSIDVIEEKQFRIFSMTDEIFYLVRRLTIGDEKKSELENAFLPPQFVREISIDPNLAFEKRINILQPFSEEKSISLAIKNLEMLRNIVLTEKSKKELIKDSIYASLLSEFDGKFCSEFTDRISKISIKEKEQTILEIKFSNNKVLSFSMDYDLVFNDATLIDTPIIMQLSNIMKVLPSRLRTINRTKNDNLIPLHWRDLHNKLVGANYAFDDGETTTLDKLIDGSMAYDKESESFQYRKVVDNTRFDVSATNTASGVKALSILNLLLKGGQINTRSLLVIDEPEVNLHPGWQIEYARIISLLVDSGVTVIVTTHSPYMIDAFKTYDKLMRLESKFYLANKCDKGLAKFDDYTSRVDELIESLAEPLDFLQDVLVNEVMDDTPN